MVTWTAAKKFCSQQDYERFACLAWTMIDSGHVSEADWQKAAPHLPFSVKLASVKRQIWAISKKVKENSGDPEAVPDGTEEDATGKAKGGKSGGKKGGAKRKTPETDDSGENEAGSKPKKSKVNGKKTKDTAVEHRNGSLNGVTEALIKTEEAEDENEFFAF